MIFFRRSQRLSAWIACLAILWAALAPSLAQAVTAGGSDGTLMEICTAFGTKWVKVNSVEQAPDDSSLSGELVHFEHCPFCLSSDAPGLPPSGGFRSPLAEGQASLPILFYQSPRPLFTWAPAQSRAPPAL